MSATVALAAVVAIWLVTGLIIAFVMRRRGHDFWVWLTLGAVLGPLAIPLAVERARYHPAEYEVGERTPSHGGLDVVAAVDGSTESTKALKTALDLFGDEVTSVTIVKVLDYDSSGAYTGEEIQRDAKEMLETLAAGISGPPVATELLFGRPDRAIADYAAGNDIELIVVGARGHGMSEALFGSVTGRLVGASPVPVFVGASDDAAERGAGPGADSGMVTSDADN